jgi:hypothetical protein
MQRSDASHWESLQVLGKVRLLAHRRPVPLSRAAAGCRRRLCSEARFGLLVDRHAGTLAIERANLKKGLEPVSDSPYIRDPGAIVGLGRRFPSRCPKSLKPGFEEGACSCGRLIFGQVERSGRDAWAAALGSRWLRHPSKVAGRRPRWRSRVCARGLAGCRKASCRGARGLWGACGGIRTGRL